MKITYNITKEAYWNFSKYALLNNSKMKLNMLLGSIILIVLSFTAIYMVTRSLVYSIIVTIIANVIISWYNLVSTKRKIMSLVSDDDGFIGEHTIEIKKEELIETTKHNNTSANWTGISKIEAIKDYILIWVNSQNAHVIPKQAFSSLEEAEKFFNLAKEYHKEVQS